MYWQTWRNDAVQTHMTDWRAHRHTHTHKHTTRVRESCQSSFRQLFQFPPPSLSHTWGAFFFQGTNPIFLRDSADYFLTAKRYCHRCSDTTQILYQLTLSVSIKGCILLVVLNHCSVRAFSPGINLQLCSFCKTYNPSQLTFILSSVCIHLIY